MSTSNSFWITSAPQWEKRRYRGLFSRLVFSSLSYRRKYLLFILNQLPAGSRVLELGCGSGLLFNEISDKGRLNYTGVDISPEAIESATRNFASFPNATWVCTSAENIKAQTYDYVVSAGFLDWVSDEVVRNFLRENQTKYHVHSFSEERHNSATFAHRLFARLISRKAHIKYEPRKFKISEIQANFSTVGSMQIVRNRKLSFGAFAHNLPSSLTSSFEAMLVSEYFSTKKTGFTERLFKQKEFAAVDRALPSLTGLKVLEAGSGHGFYSRWLVGQKPDLLLCVDAFVNTAHYVPGIDFRQIRAEDVQTGPFDVILALGVLEFTSDAVQFMQQMTDLVAPGGRLLLLVPRSRSPVTRIYSWFHRLRGIEVPVDLEKQLNEILTKQKASFEKIDGGPLNFLFIIKKDGKTDFIRS